VWCSRRWRRGGQALTRQGLDVAIQNKALAQTAQALEGVLNALVLLTLHVGAIFGKHDQAGHGLAAPRHRHRLAMLDTVDQLGQMILGLGEGNGDHG
jgi:hypothetical protein